MISRTRPGLGWRQLFESRAVVQANISRHGRFFTRYHSSSIGVAESGITVLSNRTLIKVSGTDSQKYLHGLTTSNIGAAHKYGQYTAFLNPTGKVLMDAFVWPFTNKEDGQWAYLLDVEKNTDTKLMIQYLLRHKLRSKVKVEMLESFSIWAGWLPREQSGQYEYKSPELDNDVIVAPGYMADPRIPGLTHRFILPSNALPADSSLGLFYPVARSLITSIEQYDLQRFFNGVAEGGRDIPYERFHAHSLNLDILNAVDFRKGCYVGQELTIRTEHTGVVRRRILPVKIYRDDEPPPVELTYRSAEDAVGSNFRPFSIAPDTKIFSSAAKRETGRLLRSIGNIGLAICHLETMTDLKISPEVRTPTSSCEFFLDPIVTSGFRIKAFVPDWLRDQLVSRKQLRASS